MSSVLINVKFIQHLQSIFNILQKYLLLLFTFQI